MTIVAALPVPADRCPRCCVELVAPSLTEQRGGRVVGGYECPCGYRWATVWDTASLDAGVRRG